MADDYRDKYKHNFSQPVVLWDTGLYNEFNLPPEGSPYVALGVKSSGVTGSQTLVINSTSATGSNVVSNVISSPTFSTIEEAILGTASPITLQTVTDDGGNSTSNKVFLNNGFESSASEGVGASLVDVTGGVISLGNIYGAPGFDPSEVRIMGSTGVGIIGKGFGPAWLQTSNLTTERIVQFPDEDGTLSLSNDVYATQNTGTTVSFDKPKVYNLPASPATASITNSLTNAKIGVVQKLYHQYTTPPTFPGGWVKVGGTYSTSLLNIIYSEYVTGTRVEYWLINI